MKYETKRKPICDVVEVALVINQRRTGITKLGWNADQKRARLKIFKINLAFYFPLH